MFVLDIKYVFIYIKLNSYNIYYFSNCYLAFMGLFFVNKLMPNLF